jgi:4'-phosphopantetheinyl transferase
MSYGDPFIAVAVSPQKNIGVDIEVEHAIPKDEIPWHLFSDHEQRQLTLSFTENFPHAFFRLWTLKEAIAKRTGQGFATEFSEIETTGLAIIDGMDRIDELTAKGDVLVHTALVLEDKAVHLAVSSG